MTLSDERTLEGSEAGRFDTLIDEVDIVDLEARYRIEGTLGQGGMVPPIPEWTRKWRSNESLARPLACAWQVSAQRLHLDTPLP